MCSKIYVILIVCFLFVESDGLRNVTKGTINLETADTEQKSLFMLFATLLISTILNYFLTYFKFNIPLGALLIIIGILFGLAANYFTLIREYTPFISIPARMVQELYFPMMTFKISFCIDYHMFLTAIGQIFILSVPVYLCSVVTVGFVMTVMIKPDWPPLMSILFGNICFGIYPITLVNILTSIGSHTRPTCILLEGEAMISLGVHALIHTSIIRSLSNRQNYTQTVITSIISTILFKPIIGIVCGLLGSFLMRVCYNDRITLVLVAISMPLISHFAMNEIPFGSTTFSIFIVGFVMGLERKALPSKLNQIVLRSWEVLVRIMDNIIYTEIGVWFSIYVIRWIEATDILWICMTYVIVTIARFFSIFVFLPLLSRIGYGLKFQNMLVIVWGGLKNPVILSTVAAFRDTNMDINDGRLFLLHVVPLFLLELLINGTTSPFLLKILGVTQISLPRQINMNNCMKIITERRERTLGVLKMDRLLSDANWLVVNTSTEIRHPYAINFTNEEEENEIALENRVATCPACKVTIPNEPTAKELKEMLTEARLRCLKTKKIEYAKQYENALLSKDGFHTLMETIEFAMDSKNAQIDLTVFEKLFSKKRLMNSVIFSRAKYLGGDYTIRPPVKRHRRFCYNLMRRDSFVIFIYIIVIVNILLAITEIALDNLVSMSFHHLTFVVLNTIIVFIYIMECIIKILGYARVHLVKDGVVTYFRSMWNVIDFTVLAFCLFELIITYLDLFEQTEASPEYLHFLGIVKLVRSMRLIALIRYCKVCYPRCINIFNRRSNKKMAFAFEVGFAFIKAENEVLEMLPYMIDNEKIREQMKQTLQNDRIVIMRLLGRTKRKRPWVGVTVKTKQAVMIVLNGLRDDINELKLSGWIDEVENKKLTDALDERYKFIACLNYIPPQRPKDVFKEIVWLGKDEIISEFLYSNVITRNYEPGDVVCKEGDVIEGVYILMTGLLLQSYIPNSKALNELEEYGVLPVVDYPGLGIYNESFTDFIVQGNTFGELSVLTSRSYSSRIISDTHSRIYIIPQTKILEAKGMSLDPLFGLESRMWKALSVRIAVPLLLSLPAYQTSTTHLMKQALERSFIPDLSNFKMFVVNNKIEDMLLIEGMAVDYMTRDIYTGPCYIPRRALANVVATKLLIIPVMDADEYEIMMEAENVCELVNKKSSKCIRHYIQQQPSKVRKRRKRNLVNFGRTSKGMKQQGQGLSLKSGLAFVSTSSSTEIGSKTKKKTSYDSLFKP